jgi:predicted MFS family arabinose efflux permease
VPPNRWLILLVLFLARAAMSFQFQTIGAVGPLLIDRLHIDFTWLGTLIGLYMLPGTIVALLVNFSPGLFTRSVYSAQSAGGIVSLLGWGTIPLVPLAGFAVERIKRPDLFMVTGFVLSSLLTLALPFASAPVPLLLCLVIVTSLPAGPIFRSLLAQVLSPQNRAGRHGRVLHAVLSRHGDPAGAGREFRDVTGDAAAPTLFASAMMASGLVLLVLLIVFRTSRSNDARLM